MSVKVCASVISGSCRIVRLDASDDRLGEGSHRHANEQLRPAVYGGAVERNEDLDWLRTRLVSIEAEIRSTSPDALQAKFDLARAADSCRSMLRSGNAEAVAAARALWNERAANKGTHEQNLAALEAMARFMPSEGGGPG
jgi:hypothetical protein